MTIGDAGGFSFNFLFSENDAEAAAVGKGHAIAEMALIAEAIEKAGESAGVLAEFGRFAFESIHLLDDLDGNEDMIVFEVEEAVWVVE
jgi:hypothetical protein